MREIIVENYWDRTHCHYSSIQELVDYYIQSGKEDNIGYALERVVQFNGDYRNYLQDNGFPALVERLKSETIYLEQCPVVKQKLEEWWENIQKSGGLGDYDIQCYAIEDTFSMFGKQIDGIKGLRQILQMHGEAGPYSKPPKLFESSICENSSSNEQDDKEVSLFAALLWESYPRFDISDYSDNREYHCYYVRNHQFNEDFFKDSKSGGMEHIREDIPLSRLPLVYRDGNAPVMFVASPRHVEGKDAIDVAIRNLLKRVDNEVPECGPFKKIYEYFDNTDASTEQYVDRCSIFIYDVPVESGSTQGNRFVEVAAYAKDSPYKATTLIAYGNNSKIKEYLANPKCRQDVVENLKMLAEEIRFI